LSSFLKIQLKFSDYNMPQAGNQDFPSSPDSHIPTCTIAKAAAIANTAMDAIRSRLRHSGGRTTPLKTKSASVKLTKTPKACCCWSMFIVGSLDEFP